MFNFKWKAIITREGNSDSKNYSEIYCKTAYEAIKYLERERQRYLKAAYRDISKTRELYSFELTKHCIGFERYDEIVKGEIIKC